MNLDPPPNSTPTQPLDATIDPQKLLPVLDRIRFDVAWAVMGLRDLNPQPSDPYFASILANLESLKARVEEMCEGAKELGAIAELMRAESEGRRVQ
jgi:hypothetical protein